MRLRDMGAVIRAAVDGWVEDNALRLSAALAYYALFSMAPLLILAISLSGLVYGEQAARGQIAEQMKQLAGSRAAEAIQTLILSASGRATSVSVTVVGLVILLFGASGAFVELKDALNTIWGVELKPGNTLLNFTRGRVVSFTMVLAVGFLLLVSLAVTAAVAAFTATMQRYLAVPPGLLRGADIVISLVIVTMLFAMVFKVLPNVELRWGDVWMGAGCTSFLFTVGKFLIGFYLGTSGVASYYGAAGSAVVILLWVYYSACILFFGAEFTKAWVLKSGGTIVPDSRAVRRGSAVGGKIKIH